MSHVLIVDDEPMLLTALRREVEREKHTVCGVNGLYAATAAVQKDRFNIAMVDYSLEGPNGLQVLKMLREIQPGCARVLISGHLQLPVIIEALNDGLIHQVLSKPISRQELQTTLDTCHDLQHRLQTDLAKIRANTRQQERSLVERFLAERHLKLALQPILYTDSRKVFAHEALLRSSMTELRGPMDVISAAESCDMLLDITAEVAQRAAEWIPQLPEGTMLFINIHPEELSYPERMLQNLMPLHPWSNKVVLEVTEHTRIAPSWIAAIQKLRTLGFLIAVDDVGAGYNSLMTLATLQPNFIKVDMSITRNINADLYKQRLMSLLVQLADGTSSMLLAEGVETDEEADTLVELGVHLVQGYRFGRPSLTPDFAKNSMSA